MNNPKKFFGNKKLHNLSKKLHQPNKVNKIQRQTKEEKKLKGLMGLTEKGIGLFLPNKDLLSLSSNTKIKKKELRSKDIKLKYPNIKKKAPKVKNKKSGICYENQNKKNEKKGKSKGNSKYDLLSIKIQKRIRPKSRPFAKKKSPLNRENYPSKEKNYLLKLKPAQPTPRALLKQALRTNTRRQAAQRIKLIRTPRSKKISVDAPKICKEWDRSAKKGISNNDLAVPPKKRSGVVKSMTSSRRNSGVFCLKSVLRKKSVQQPKSTSFKIKLKENELKNQSKPPTKFQNKESFFVEHQKLKSKFELFLSQTIQIDDKFKNLSREIKEFFDESNPESWILGFETSHILYQRHGTLEKRKTGEIYIARQILTNQELTIESISKQQVPSDAVRDRINRLRALSRSPYVVPFFESFEDPHKHFLVFESVSQRNLEQFLASFEFESENDKTIFLCLTFYKIIKGVQSIHSFGVCHGALSPENILIDDAINPRIRNFENSSIIGKCRSGPTTSSTSKFGAPELESQRSEMSLEVDVYACGRILEWMMVRLSDSDCCSFRGRKQSLFMDLLPKMIYADPKSRISLENVVLHKCFDFIKFFSSDNLNFDAVLKYCKKNPDCLSFSKGPQNATQIAPSNLYRDRIFSFGQEDPESNYEKSPYLDRNLLDDLSSQTIARKGVSCQNKCCLPPKVGLRNSTQNTNPKNKQPERCGEQAQRSDMKDQITQILIIKFLGKCGFPEQYLKELLLEGSSGKFTHVEACYKVLFNRFIN